jgi:hypothetical protein
MAAVNTPLVKVRTTVSQLVVKLYLESKRPASSDFTV